MFKRFYPSEMKDSTYSIDFDALYKNIYDDNLNVENIDSIYIPLLNGYIPKSYNKTKIIITSDDMINKSHYDSINNKRGHDSIYENEDENGNKKAKTDL